MTSFINIKYGNVAVEIIPQRTAFCYPFAVGKRLSANVIQSEMRPVYDEKYFTRPAIHVWCKKFAHGRESVVDEEELGRHVVSTTDATIVAVDSFIRSIWRVYVNLDDTLKSETLNCLTFKHVCLLDLFTFLV